MQVGQRSPRAVRILTVGNMYPPHHLGGYELMWRSAVAHHRAAGHDVRVLTTDWHEHYVDASTPEDADVHRELRWYWHDHDFPRLGPLARRALESHNAGVLDRHLDEFRPHALSWWAMGGMSLSLIERAHRAGLPAAAVVVVDDWLLYGPKVDAWWRLLRRRATRLEDACRWLFASETLLGRARESGFRPADVRMAHPGIDLDLFAGGRGGHTPSAGSDRRRDRVASPGGGNPGPPPAGAGGCSTAVASTSARGSTSPSRRSPTCPTRPRYASWAEATRGTWPSCVP